MSEMQILTGCQNIYCNRVHKSAYELDTAKGETSDKVLRPIFVEDKGQSCGGWLVQEVQHYSGEKQRI